MAYEIQHSDPVSTILLGDTARRQQLQRDIADLQTKIRNTLDDTVRTQLMGQLAALQNRLAEEMQKQGAADQYGKLYAAKDVQSQYYDQDYLNLRRQQAKELEAQQQAQSLRAGKQLNLRGVENYNPALMAGTLENVQRTNQQQLAGDLRSEMLRAKGEAGTELSRKQAYAQTLSAWERDNIINQITQQLALANVDIKLIDAAQQELNSMPDGLLTQLANVGSNALISWATSGFSSFLGGLGKGTEMTRSPAPNSRGMDSTIDYSNRMGR